MNLPAIKWHFVNVQFRGLSRVLFFPPSLILEALSYCCHATGRTALPLFVQVTINLPSHYRCCKLQLHLAPMPLQDLQQEVEGKRRWACFSLFTLYLYWITLTAGLYSDHTWLVLKCKLGLWLKKQIILLGIDWKCISLYCIYMLYFWFHGQRHDQIISYLLTLRGQQYV